jgi:hypothetical protein
MDKGCKLWVGTDREGTLILLPLVPGEGIMTCTVFRNPISIFCCTFSSSKLKGCKQLYKHLTIECWNYVSSVTANRYISWSSKMCPWFVTMCAWFVIHFSFYVYVWRSVNSVKMWTDVCKYGISQGILSYSVTEMFISVLIWGFLTFWSTCINSLVFILALFGRLSYVNVNYIGKQSFWLHFFSCLIYKIFS